MNALGIATAIGTPLTKLAIGDLLAQGQKLMKQQAYSKPAGPAVGPGMAGYRRPSSGFRFGWGSKSSSGSAQPKQSTQSQPASKSAPAPAPSRRSGSSGPKVSAKTFGKMRERIGNAKAAVSSSHGDAFMSGVRKNKGVDYKDAAKFHEEKMNKSLKSGSAGGATDVHRSNRSAAHTRGMAHWAGKHWKGLAATGAGAYALHRATKDDE